MLSTYGIVICKNPNCHCASYMRVETDARSDLLKLLQDNTKDERILPLIEQLEPMRPADLRRDRESLTGAWELRWSSSKQPWLKQASWLENLQLLDLKRGLGMNLLRPKGFLSSIAAVSVQADLAVLDQKRVEVKFRTGGWIGPILPSGRRLRLFKEVTQSFPAWLDITILDEKLRVCRGNAGTIFALTRRTDINIDSLM